jgi:hypothetical protein
MRSLTSFRWEPRRWRRRLFVEILEDRTPASESTGAALTLAGLAGTAAPRGAALPALPPSSFADCQCR